MTLSAAILELELISGSPLLVNSEIRELSTNSDKIFNSTTPFFSVETVDSTLPLSSDGMKTKFQAIVLHLQLFIYTCF